MSDVSTMHLRGIKAAINSSRLLIREAGNAADYFCNERFVVKLGVLLSHYNVLRLYTGIRKDANSLIAYTTSLSIDEDDIDVLLANEEHVWSVTYRKDYTSASFLEAILANYLSDDIAILHEMQVDREYRSRLSEGRINCCQRDYDSEACLLEINREFEARKASRKVTVDDSISSEAPVTDSPPPNLTQGSLVSEGDDSPKVTANESIAILQEKVKDREDRLAEVGGKYHDLLIEVGTLREVVRRREEQDRVATDNLRTEYELHMRRLAAAASSFSLMTGGNVDERATAAPLKEKPKGLMSRFLGLFNRKH